MELAVALSKYVGEDDPLPLISEFVRWGKSGSLYSAQSTHAIQRGVAGDAAAPPYFQLLLRLSYICMQRGIASF